MPPVRKSLQMFSVLSTLFGGSGACASTGGAWHELASSAQMLGPGQVDAADKALAGLSKEQRATAEAALDAIAALPATADGIHSAGLKIRDTRVALPGAGPRVSGTDPSVAAFLQGADCALHGLVYRSGQAVAAGADRDAAALALLKAVREDLKVFPVGSTGQVEAPAWVENELRLGLTPPVYLTAVRAMQGATP